MAWKKKVWVDNQTPLCAENMNHLEDGIDSKVDKSTSKKVLYGTNDEGTAQVVLPYSLLPGESNIAQFDTGGHLYTKLPSIGDHCANKEYVDSCVQNMSTDINVDSNHKLILEHNGTEIPGQKKQVVVPPFTYNKNDKKFDLSQVLSIQKLIIGGTSEYLSLICDRYSFKFYNLDLQSRSFGWGIDKNSNNNYYIVFGANATILSDEGINTSHWDHAIRFPNNKSGTVALLNDITSALENNLPFGTNTDIDNMF